MARKPEKAIFAFVRKGNALVPELDYDLRALDGVKNGQRVRVEVKEWRNLDRLRLYWKMLSSVVSATECAPTPEHLHSALKLELGFCTPVRIKGGFTVLVPESIAIEKMDEPTFAAFFDRSVQFIAANYGVDPLQFYQEKAA